MNLNQIRKKISLFIGGLCLALWGSTIMASSVQLDKSNVRVLQQSKGWQLMDVQNEALSAKSNKKAFSRVYLITSLEGIKSAPIDASIKKELMQTHRLTKKKGEEFFVAINADVAESGLSDFEEDHAWYRRHGRCVPHGTYN